MPNNFSEFVPLVRRQGGGAHGVWAGLRTNWEHLHGRNGVSVLILILWQTYLRTRQWGAGYYFIHLIFLRLIIQAAQLF